MSANERPVFPRNNRRGGQSTAAGCRATVDTSAIVLLNTMLAISNNLCLGLVTSSLERLCNEFQSEVAL